MHTLESFNHLLNQSGTRVALTNPERDVTWHELRLSIESWRVAFAARPEATWALYCLDTGIFLAALLGAWQAGKHVYLPSDALPATVASLHEYDVAFAGDFALSQLSAADIQLCAPTLTAHHIAPTVRTFFFTSGSTGKPCPIAKTMRQLLTEVQVLQQQFGAQLATHPVYASVSHQHFYGFIFRLLLPLIGRCAISNRLLNYPENLLALPHAPYTLISSPAFLSRASADSDWSDLPRPQVVFSAGGVLKTADSAQIGALWDCAPIEIYGSTETGAVAYRQADVLFAPLPTVQVSVDEAQQLCVRSDYLDVDEPMFVTSDLARIDSCGKFALRGRTDRLVKIEEKRISLTQIEALLQNHELIDDAQITVLESARTTLGAVLCLNAAGATRLASIGRRALIDEFKLPLKNTIERIAIPKRWRFVAQMPLNSQGKVEQKTLLQLLNAPEICTLPQIVSQIIDEACAQLDLVIPVDLQYFQGHFAEQAILPGVVQIEWAQRYSQLFFGAQLPDAPLTIELKKLKFKKIISPAAQVRLQLTLNNQKVDFSYTSDLGTHASGTLIWSDA
jgi:acyl-CoA synthetase (AMP-forming)/AMP-acid ligase II/3-hydroxymyristoyl/3-hydroxydecanoyl-(acyl carrier protein) dehydratase